MSIKIVIVTTRPTVDTPWFGDVPGNVDKLAVASANLESAPGFLGQTTEDTPLKRTKTIEFTDDTALRNYVTTNEIDIQQRGTVKEAYLQEHGCTEDIYLA